MGNEESAWLGFREDASIPDVLETLENEVRGFATVLIRCLDSWWFESVPEVRGVFSRYLDEGSCFPFGFVLDGAGLLRIHEEDAEFFTGFDEVWLWHERIQPRQPPPIAITSEAALAPPRGPTLYTDEELGRLRAWMLTSRCSLGLGDGCGLNYITSLRHWVDRLEKIRPDG
ncbi:MAG: hypothetical protein KKC18_17070 [Chloroflexi bacterium]|nr:hypothetical protein [Chloroflexota bacterium]